MNPRGNAHTLVQARRRDSLDKRQRVLTALTTLEQQGKKITHTAVARTAGVSTWLTYTEGIREHIEAAQQRQQPKVTRPAETRTPNATLRTELELARQEVRDLREEKERMRQALRHQVGQQLDALGTKDLTERVDHLARDNQRLQDTLRQATEDNHALRSRVTSLEADLGAARTSLRRMIREENRSP
jgi:chromosome segregation ATPase